jgi:hypothetical protein
MKTLTLTRTHTDADGVFGELHAEAFALFTAEDDWRNNAAHVSCIPEGKYWLRRRFSAKHNCDVFEVADVPGRSDIEIHWGNTEENVEGCILVGLHPGRFTVEKDEDTGEPHKVKEGVADSREAFRRLMDYLQDDNEAMLLIQWAPGLP